MRSIEVCLPNKISEQQRIVAYLDSSFDKIDEMKANAAKALSEAKALFQAELKKCMEKKEGWEENTLDSFAEIQSGYAFRSSEFQSSGRYQIIRMGNVRPGTLRLKENAVFLDSVEDDNVLSKALLKKGDIVITQTGTRNKRDYGFTTIIDKDNLLLNQRIARIRVVDTLDNKYLLYYTWADRFRDQFFANEGGTVGQGNVGMDAIRGNIIHFPPLEIQHSIVTHLDSLSQKVQELEQNYNTILAECDALKQAILRETFE